MWGNAEDEIDLDDISSADRRSSRKASKRSGTSSGVGSVTGSEKTGTSSRAINLNEVNKKGKDRKEGRHESGKGEENKENNLANKENINEE